MTLFVDTEFNEDDNDSLSSSSSPLSVLYSFHSFFVVFLKFFISLPLPLFQCKAETETENWRQDRDTICMKWSSSCLEWHFEFFYSFLPSLSLALISQQQQSLLCLLLFIWHNDCCRLSLWCHIMFFSFFALFPSCHRMWRWCNWERRTSNQITNCIKKSSLLSSYHRMTLLILVQNQRKEEGVKDMQMETKQERISETSRRFYMKMWKKFAIYSVVGCQVPCLSFVSIHLRLVF